MTNQDNSKNSVRAIRHKPTRDSESLNQAVDRTINDQNFLVFLIFNTSNAIFNNTPAEFPPPITTSPLAIPYMTHRY
ncbi:MAG: hypothetical protein WAK17_20850 [Candidatus Nitrosopolaris sp.]